MKRCASFFGFIFIYLCLALPANGQDYKEMREELVQKQKITRAEIVELNDQINQYQERLNLADQKYDRLYKQYEDLKRIIALQEEKISKLEQEQQHIREEISLIERAINQNGQRLRQLTEDYEKTLSYIYKHGRATHLALIFSSSSINQMLIRAYYLDKFATYRQNQAQKIKDTQEELRNNKNQLEQAREKNSAVLAEIQAEKQEQEAKRQLQEKNVALLRRDRQQIKSKLEEKQRELERLNNILTSIYLETGRPRVGAMDEATLTEMGESFAAAKGSLPWPVESSTISEHFGSRRHPVYGTVTPNPGIEIVTKAQEPVRVIHDGYVVRAQPITGFGDVVVVKHGKFFTAYGNLSKIMVRTNTVLSEGDVIGLAGDEYSARGKSVFFMVRENNTNVDPEDWIKDK